MTRAPARVQVYDRLQVVSAASGSSEPGPAGRPPVPIGLVIVALAVYRIAYHLAYVGESPFAAATFSDGSIYELSALDIAEHPPLGTEAFYLQGAYAYVLALPMAIGRLPAALASQLVMAAATWLILWRALLRIVDRPTALTTIAVGLGYASWAFYENKFLTAELTLFASVLVLAAWSRLEARVSTGGAVVLGLASGLAVLARPNLLLLIGPLAVAVFVLARACALPVLPRIAGVVLGCALALAPMTVRNAIVTGHATFLPAHGGGTSFFIGNNAGANGVWNGGSLLSGDVTHEADEVRVERAPGESRAQAVGRELYARAWHDITADPMRWIGLELRKLWLVVGNQELSQDYDVAGERELIPWAWPTGVPFGVLLGLAIPGAVLLRRRDRVLWPARAWAVGGLAFATVAANLAFFTSAQHRLPLVVPVLVFAAPAIGAIADAIARRAWAPLAELRRAWVIAVVIALQAAWPRARTHGPPAAHYFNLALAYDQVAEFGLALVAFDRAVERAPEQPVIRVERAVLRRRMGLAEGAREDLRVVDGQRDVPAWVRERAAMEAFTLGMPFDLQGPS